MKEGKENRKSNSHPSTHPVPLRKKNAREKRKEKEKRV